MGNVDKVIMRACSYSTSQSTYTTSSAAEIMHNRLNAESFFFSCPGLTWANSYLPG